MSDMSDRTTKPTRVLITAELPTEMSDDQVGIAPEAREHLTSNLVAMGLNNIDVQVQG